MLERYKLFKDKKIKFGGILVDCICLGKLYYVCVSMCIFIGKKFGFENNWYFLLILRCYNKFEKKKKKFYELCLNVCMVVCVI